MPHIPPRPAAPPAPPPRNPNGNSVLNNSTDVTKELGLRITNVPKASEPGKRVIGFVMDQDEIEIMGLFEKELIEMSILFLNTKGFIVEKDS